MWFDYKTNWRALYFGVWELVNKRADLLIHIHIDPDLVPGSNFHRDIQKHKLLAEYVRVFIRCMITSVAGEAVKLLFNQENMKKNYQRIQFFAFNSSLFTFFFIWIFLVSFKSLLLNFDTNFERILHFKSLPNISQRSPHLKHDCEIYFRKLKPHNNSYSLFHCPFQSQIRSLEICYLYYMIIDHDVNSISRMNR